MKRDEIWIAELPATNGHEQHGFRPAIIVAATQMNIVTVIPCTANVQALRFPFTLRIDPSKKNGLDAPTIALLLHLRVLDRRRLIKKIGVLEQNTISRINRLLKVFLGL